MTDSFEQRRKHPRYPIRDDIRLQDQVTGKVLGMVANVSLGGLMVVGSEPLRPDCIYQAILVLGEGCLPGDNECHIALGFDCLWNSPAASEQSDLYWSGCEIIDISDQEAQRLQQWIDAVSH